MATVPASKSTSIEKLSWYLGHARHSVWDRFGAADQQRMVEDDLAAGKSVSMVLVALITAGMLLSVVSVLVVWATM
jgi:hypothetical protein